MGILAPPPASADDYGDPEYPSEEWFAREQANWARTREEPLRQANDPGFQQRWQAQSVISKHEFRTQELEETEWNRSGNVCQRFTNQCTGNPYLYPESEVVESTSEPGGAVWSEEDGDLESAYETHVLDALDKIAIDIDEPDLEQLVRVSSMFVTNDSSADVTLLEAARGGKERIPTGELPGQTAGVDGDVRLWDGHPFYDEIGDFQRVAFYDSGLDQDEGGARLSGRVWAPKDSEPGDERPGVVITNGSIQAPETLYWWFAHTLVEAGYVVMTYDPRGQGRSDNETPDGTEGGNFNPSVFVTNQVDAIDHFRSTPADPYQHNTDNLARGDEDVAPVVDYNPFWDRLDCDRLGIVGHSLGATGVSVVQGMDWPEMAKGKENPVDVAVAWDNLSSAGSELAGREVIPRVPTMGQGADYFAGIPKTSPPAPDAKNAGFESWREAGVPTYQVNVRGGTHFEWSLIPTFPATSWDGWGNELVDHYSLAWLDFWLQGDGSQTPGRSDSPGKSPVHFEDSDDAERRLLAESPWTDRLSFYYRSARYFPTAENRTEWPADDDGWHVCEDILEEC